MLEGGDHEITLRFQAFNRVHLVFVVTWGGAGFGLGRFGRLAQIDRVATDEGDLVAVVFQQ